MIVLPFLEKYPGFRASLAYLDDEALIKIERALSFATKAHEGQLRLSGDEYITHPVEVANILAELRMDYKCISAGLLHDVVEDTPYESSDIRKHFDKEIASMVDGLTKIERMPAKSRKGKSSRKFS